LSRNLFPVLGLAIPGVIISAVIAGFLVSWIFAMPILYALLFGALISATDPVAVISLFKEVGVPKRLQILVEGESLLNDAAAIVMFQLILSLIGVTLLSGSISLFETSIRFTGNVLTSFLGGMVIGTFIGLILRIVLRRTPLHPHVHQTLTLIAAYVTYLISDHLCGFSGVIAVVVCGCLTARAASDWLGPAGRKELTRFWEYIGFLANSLIFLLVGIAIASLQDLSVFLSGAVLGVIFLILAVQLARFVPVFGIFGAYNLFTPRKVPLTYQVISFWGGIRGAVAIALSLSLPLSLPYRDAIVAFSVTIVMITVLFQGLTIGPLIHYLGLGQTRLVNRFHQIYTDLIAFRAATSSLHGSAMATVIDPGTAQRFRDRYCRASAMQIMKIREFWTDIRKNPDRMSILRLFWLEAIRYEQKQYRLFYDEGLILPAVYAELQYQTASREDLIQSGDYHPGTPEQGPGTRLRVWIKRVVTATFPKSRLSWFLRQRGEMNRIFAAIAIETAAAETKQYLSRLVTAVCLDPGEIKEIFAVYGTLEREARDYLDSDAVAQSPNLKNVSAYLAERTAGAGMIARLHHHLEEGTGDEKILTKKINLLLEDKNAARRDLIRACKEARRE
jgi:CPA1 family monovalent cation:H+ antiporter